MLTKMSLNHTKTYNLNPPSCKDTQKNLNDIVKVCLLISLLVLGINTIHLYRWNKREPKVVKRTHFENVTKAKIIYIIRRHLYSLVNNNNKLVIFLLFSHEFAVFGLKKSLSWNPKLQLLAAAKLNSLNSCNDSHCITTHNSSCTTDAKISYRDIANEAGCFSLQFIIMKRKDHSKPETRRLCDYRMFGMQPTEQQRCIYWIKKNSS